MNEAVQQFNAAFRLEMPTDEPLKPELLAAMVDHAKMRGRGDIAEKLLTAKRDLAYQQPGEIK